MELCIDLATATSMMAGLDDFTTFHLRVSSPGEAGPSTHTARLDEVLRATHLGRLTPSGDAYVDGDAIRFQAAGQVGPDWEDGFAAMCEFAARRGWTDDEGSIQVHVIWPADAGPVRPPR